MVTIMWAFSCWRCLLSTW